VLGIRRPSRGAPRTWTLSCARQPSWGPPPRGTMWAARQTGAFMTAAWVRKRPCAKGEQIAVTLVHSSCSDGRKHRYFLEGRSPSKSGRLSRSPYRGLLDSRWDGKRSCIESGARGGAPSLAPWSQGPEQRQDMGRDNRCGNKEGASNYPVATLTIQRRRTQRVDLPRGPRRRKGAQRLGLEREAKI